jgi:HK97 family phage prohead protease
MLTKAFSTFTVKRVDEEQRLLTGIATTPSIDRVGDVVEPEGAEYDLPIPFLYGHDASKPIGHVTGARVSSRGIDVTVRMVRTDEPGPVKDRLDSAWQDIKLGLVRGLSIGFTGIDVARNQATGGLRFLKWRWLELSAVVIPANADAQIATVKAAPLVHRPAVARAPGRTVMRDTGYGVTVDARRYKSQFTIG